MTEARYTLTAHGEASDKIREYLDKVEQDHPENTPTWKEVIQVQESPQTQQQQAESTVQFRYGFPSMETCEDFKRRFMDALDSQCQIALDQFTTVVR